MGPRTIAVIGGLDADLTMITSRIPDRGKSVLANRYIEALGGKGANSAIATHRTCHKKSLDKERTENRVPKEPTEGGHVATKAFEQLLPALDEHGLDSPKESNIQVKMIGAIGDDRYGENFIIQLNKNGVDTSGIVVIPNMRSSICFVMVEESTRENRCLFTLGATASWKKEDFVHAEQLGNGMRPDCGSNGNQQGGGRDYDRNCWKG